MKRTRRKQTLIRFSREICVGVTLVFLLPFSSFSEKEGGLSAKPTGKDSVHKLLRDPLWPVGFYPEGWGESEEKDLLDTERQQTEARRLAEERLKAEEERRRMQMEALNKGWEQAMKKIRINGISNNEKNEFVAIINNQLKSVGDVIMIQEGKAKYFWKVVEIKPPQKVGFARLKVDLGEGDSGTTNKDEVKK